MNKTNHIQNETEYYKEKYIETLKELENIKKIAGNIANRYIQQDRLGIDTTKIIEMYKNGLSAYRIANTYNCNIGTIINRLKKAGIYKNKK